MDTSELQKIKQRYNIVGNSDGLNHALDVALQVAPTDLSVLIIGESGVGKEIIPRVIHDNSPRRREKYFAINCGSIPEGFLHSSFPEILKTEDQGCDVEGEPHSDAEHHKPLLGGIPHNKRSHRQNRGDDETGHRQNKPEVPVVALAELLLNAYYQIHGNKCRWQNDNHSVNAHALQNLHIDSSFRIISVVKTIFKTLKQQHSTIYINII